jgi:membrane associated rhomboid family serine protease
VIAACIAVFVRQISSGFVDVPDDSLTFQFGLYGPAVAEGEWWRLFTSGFLHSSPRHLGYNMLMLYFIARVVGLESRLAFSLWRFPLLYVVSLLGGSLGALLLEYRLHAIGASGAIFGLMGAQLLRDRFELGSWKASGVVYFLALNLGLTFVLPGISIGGHLGGLAAGAACGWMLFARPAADRR